MIAALTLFAILNPPGLSGEQLKIRRALAEAETEWGLLPSGPSKEEVAEIVKEIEAVDVTTEAAKGTLARALLILRQELDPQAPPNFDGMSDFLGESDDALTPGATSTKELADLNQALREVYRGDALTPEDRRRIEKTLTANDARWPLDIAASRLNRRVGSSNSAERMAGVGIAGFVALALGVLALGLIFVKPKPLGIPVKGSPAEGDRFGIRFLLFIAVMLGVGIVVASFPAANVEMSQAVMLFVTQAVMIPAVLFIAWLPLGGRSYSPSQLGLRSENFGKDCLYGIIAFFANLPAVLALALFGLIFLRWIPSGGHPIQSEMGDIGQLPLLILAVGPLTAFVEEVGFRGMLFQGLALRYKIWPAILLSGFGFAMIHPQGGALWPALAWIGGMAAYLTYQRASLIPSIVMHALHNSALILFYVFASGS